MWREWSWTELYDDALAAANGLSELGVEPGTAVTVIGDNRASPYIGMLVCCGNKIVGSEGDIASCGPASGLLRRHG